jgi:hypothetical protein
MVQPLPQTRLENALQGDLSMTTTHTNGAMARKSLASQIDRLDAILDGLAENLNEAVATAVVAAVKEAVTVAVQEAVQAAVIEVLTSPELQQRLGTAIMPVSQPAVPVAVKTAEKVRRCWGWLVGTAKGALNTATTAGKTVALNMIETVGCCLAIAQTLGLNVRARAVERARVSWLQAVILVSLAKRFRKELLVAIGVGLVVGVTCYVGGRELAAVVSGLAGFAGSLTASVLNRLRWVWQLDWVEKPRHQRRAS